MRRSDLQLKTLKLVFVDDPAHLSTHTRQQQSILTVLADGNVVVLEIAIVVVSALPFVARSPKAHTAVPWSHIFNTRTSLYAI